MVCQPDGDGSTDRGGVLAVAAGGGAAAGPGTPGDADAPRRRACRMQLGTGKQGGAKHEEKRKCAIKHRIALRCPGDKGGRFRFQARETTPHHTKPRRFVNQTQLLFTAIIIHKSNPNAVICGTEQDHYLARNGGVQTWYEVPREASLVSIPTHCSIYPSAAVPRNVTTDSLETSLQAFW